MSDFRGMAAVLEARPDHAGVKAYRHGTHRTVDPASTLARVQRYLARMGITRIANVTGLDRIGVPVVMVCRPNSRSLAGRQFGWDRHRWPIDLDREHLDRLGDVPQALQSEPAHPDAESVAHGALDSVGYADAPG